MLFNNGVNKHFKTRKCSHNNSFCKNHPGQLLLTKIYDELVFL